MAAIVVTHSRRDGTPMAQTLKNTERLDEALAGFFAIGATKITVSYPDMNVEYALVPSVTEVKGTKPEPETLPISEHMRRMFGKVVA